MDNLIKTEWSEQEMLMINGLVELFKEMNDDPNRNEELPKAVYVLLGKRNVFPSIEMMIESYSIYCDTYKVPKAQERKGVEFFEDIKETQNRIMQIFYDPKFWELLEKVRKERTQNEKQNT